MNTVIFGANGQVGQALRSTWPLSNATFLDRFQADFSRTSSVLTVLESLKPSLIVNAAAYTHVAAAEKEESLAHQINAETPFVIARWAATTGSTLIHYSTDYVFDGSTKKTWLESDPTNPLNAYGRTKLEGERLIAQSGCKHIILRTSWIYSTHGVNFMNTMLKLGSERDMIRVVNDQIGAPTWARDIAWATGKIVTMALRGQPPPSGVYHLTASGETSWYGFAIKIFEIARALGKSFQVRKVEPISTQEYADKVLRPLSSRLDTSKLKACSGIILPPWQESLRACLN